MGEKKAKSIYGPEPQSVIPEDIVDLRRMLAQFLTTKGTAQSPWSGAASGYTSMTDEGFFNNVMKNLSTAAETGYAYSPSDMGKDLWKSWGDTDYMNKLMEPQLAQARESAGMTGGFRGSTEEDYLGSAIGDTMTGFLQWLLPQEMAAKEASIGRELGAGAGALSLLGGMSGLESQLTTGEYPWLPAALQMATSYAPTGTQSMIYQPGVKWYEAMGHDVGSMMGGMGGGGGGGCCFILALGMGEVTEDMKKFRNKWFSWDGPVALGYKSMSEWLVPLAHRSDKVMSFVKRFVVAPIVKLQQNQDKFWKIRGVKILPQVAAGLLWASVWGAYGMARKLRGRVTCAGSIWG